MKNIEILDDIQILKTQDEAFKTQLKNFNPVAGSSTTSSLTSGAYSQMLSWVGKYTLTTMTKQAENIPDTSTNYVIAKAQPLNISSLVGTFNYSCMSEPFTDTITLDADHSSVDIPFFKPTSNSPIYFVIDVINMNTNGVKNGSTPIFPTIYLTDFVGDAADFNSKIYKLYDYRDTSLSITFKIPPNKTNVTDNDMLGEHYLIYKGFSDQTKRLNMDNLYTPKLAISPTAAQQGQSVSFKIKGIYACGFMQGDSNFQVGVHFTGGDDLKDDSYFTCSVNDKDYKLPILRSMWGCGDHIENGEVIREFNKETLTQDMIIKELIQVPKAQKEFIESNNAKVLSEEIATLIYLQPSKPIIDLDWSWYADTGNLHQIISPDIPPCKNIYDTRVPYNGIRKIIKKNQICLRIKNSDLGVTHDDTVEEVIQKASDYLTTHKIRVWYRTSEVTHEPLAEVPQLVDGINKITFTYPTALDANIMCKVFHENTRYNNVSGKIWLAIGDSITAAVASNFSYTNLARHYIPDCMCYNLGLSGWKVRNWGEYAIYGKQAPYYNSSTSTSFAAQIVEKLKVIAKNPAPPNLITIALGVNDRAYVKLGSIYDAPSNAQNASFYACYHFIIRELMKAYPLAKIVIISPPRTGQESSGILTYSQDIANFGINFSLGNDKWLFEDMGELTTSVCLKDYAYILHDTVIRKGQTLDGVNIRTNLKMIKDNNGNITGSEKDVLTLFFIKKDINTPNYQIIGKRNIAIECKKENSTEPDFYEFEAFTAPEECFIAFVCPRLLMNRKPNYNSCSRAYYQTKGYTRDTPEDSMVLLEESCTTLTRACELIAKYYNFKFINIQNGGGFTNLSNTYCGDSTDLLGTNWWGSGDGLHPNDLAHIIMFDFIASQL